MKKTFKRKRARTKNILRNIKGSLNRFFSILFIVALGAGFMAGLFATSPDMYDTVNAYMNEYKYYDLDLKSTLGFSAEDVAEIAKIAGIDQMQAANVVDMMLVTENEDNYTARIFAILDENNDSTLNKFVLKEGRLPQNEGECVVQSVTGKYLGGNLQIGDVLTPANDGGTNIYSLFRSAMKTESLTVVGFVESPVCISVTSEATIVGSGSIGLDIYVGEDFFDVGYYTDVFITLKGAREYNTFYDEYEKFVSDSLEPFEKLEKERAPLRAAEMKKEIDSLLSQLDSLITEYEDIVSTKKKLEEDALKRIENNEKTAAIVEKSDPELAAELRAINEEIRKSLENRDDADEKLLAKLKEQKAGYDKTVAALSECTWLKNMRSDSSGFSSFQSNVGKVSALSKIFPVFFFVVALLVSLTTMTRLVDEHRGQIGTLKGLGFSAREILGEYLLYGFLASALGCALGFAVGFVLFPKAISSAYAMMFIIPETITPLRPEIMLWVAPVTVGSILLATLWAAWTECRACPAVLMQPKAPAAGKRILLERIPFIWKNLSFTHKVTCRNLFRYKKRLFMTIIGVAGCSALLVAGFGIRDSVNDIVDKQFGELYHYNLCVIGSSYDEMLADSSVRAILGNTEKIESWNVFSETKGKVIVGDNSLSVGISVPQDPSVFGELIVLKDRKTGKTIDFSEDGVILTEKLCETLGIRVGDEVTLESADGKRGAVVVKGICENHISSFAYISEATYKSAFGSDPEYSMIFCRANEKLDAEKLTSELIACGSVLYAYSSETVTSSFSESIKSIDGVVVVLIIAAGLLCIVVLYNLTNVNICERRKELATIRVLGFHEREVENYIFRETNTLSVIGTLLGLLIGVWLHSFIVRTVEIDMVMFGRSIYFTSFLYSFGISMVFTFIVNCIMRRQIKKVDMVEAMKANE